MKTWIVLSCLIAFAGAGRASIVYDANAIGGGVPTNGEASFTINANSLVITLTNTGTAGNVQDIGSELDGIKFTFADGSAVLSAASLSGVATGGVDCSSGTCVASTPPASPFGWNLVGTTTYTLSAGNGSFKPEAIVNNNVAVADGVSNAQHNPLLLGPVTFTITFTGTAPTGFSSVQLLFGTGPTTVDGTTCTTNCGGGIQSVPEPFSLALVGSGLALLGMRRLRRR